MDALPSGDVWAVGYHFVTQGTTATAFEHYDGSAWTTVPGPDPGGLSKLLAGVAVAPSGTIWAVGDLRRNDLLQTSLVESDDGSGWAIAPARNIASDALRAVWAVLRANERAVLESVTLADLASGRLPDMSCLGRAHRG